MRSLLTRKPGPSRTTTGTFPIRATKATEEASTCGSVFFPATTSTSGILVGGLKKCIPTILPGLRA